MSPASANPTNPVPSAPTNPEPSADLSATLEQAERQLAKLNSKLRSSSRITGVVGFLILIVISGWFVYGYTEIEPRLRPKELVDTASGFIDNQLPQIRQRLESQIKDNADDWAQRASDEGFEAIPKLRVMLEDFVIEKLNEELFDRVATLTEEEFRKFLTDHRDVVERTFAELADNPKASEELLAELEQALEEELGVEMKTQAEDLLKLLEQLADEVERLKAGKKLAALELKKRNILMIARRLQTDQGLESEGDDRDMLKGLLPEGLLKDQDAPEASQKEGE